MDFAWAWGIVYYKLILHEMNFQTLSTILSFIAILLKDGTLTITHCECKFSFACVNLAVTVLAKVASVNLVKTTFPRV